MRHLVTLEVEGRPASFATAHETAWKETVEAAIAHEVPAPWAHERFSIRLRFRTVAPTRAGEEWDLDNLIKPTLDAMSGVLGERQWRGVAQPADDRVDHLEAWKSTVRDGESPGVTIEVWAIADEPRTPPFSRPDLELRGFEGFEPFLDLDPTHVPKKAGVYAVLRERDDRPTFLEQSRGGHFKARTRRSTSQHSRISGPTARTASTSARRRRPAAPICGAASRRTGTTDVVGRLRTKAAGTSGSSMVPRSSSCAGRLWMTRRTPQRSRARSSPSSELTTDVDLSAISRIDRCQATAAANAE